VGPRGGPPLPVGAARRALRVRRLRRAGTRPDAAGGSRLLADRVLLTGPDDEPGAGLGAPLPVDQQGHPRVLPLAAAAGPAGFDAGDRGRRAARDDVPAAGAAPGGADALDR